MRECRKCGKVIPNWIRLEGKAKNLRNRKFCLDCSPYRGHNTSAFDPIERKKFDKKGKYTEKYKELVKVSLYKRALERKEKLIEIAGGGCKVCGYNRCKRAITFHHRDRSTKLFGLSLNNLWSKSWEQIVEELAKCDLLCMNCHAEIEDELAKSDSGLVAKVNAKYGTNF